MESVVVNIHTHTLRAGELSPRCEGLHPWQADAWQGEEFSPSPQCEAVGEIGLDYACGVSHQAQERLFRAQLKVAEERELPVVLHCVRAFEPTLKLLSGYRLRAVIFHGFIGSTEQAQRALRAGYYLAFGERSLHSTRTLEAMRQMPLERLFVESDESPTPIEELYQRVAEVVGVTVEELKKQTLENFKQIFR